MGAALAVLVAASSPALVGAQATDALVIPRLTEPIRFDGRVNEAAWEAVPPFTLTMFIPTAGSAPSEPTEIRLAHDDEYLYVSGRFLVEDPQAIRTTSLGRDQLGMAEDHFMVILDTYNDGRTAVVFSTNPGGAITDFAVDDEGGSVNYNWNTYWEAATSRDASGWYAEYKIPFSSLRFQPLDGQTTMGLILHRMTAGRNEMATFPALSPDFANALVRPSLARKIRLDGVRPRAPVYLTPYLLGGGTSKAALDAASRSFAHQTEDAKEGGLDLKYGVSSNLVLDLTLNTDFAQVEADDQQVNLTRFSLFFPEKRQFFQDRSGSFQLGTGGPGDPSLLFHSRRIGLTEAGEPLRIYGGARMAGRVGEWDIGALSMQTATGAGGSENISVVRARHAVFNGGSFLGAMVTGRLGSPRGSNVVYAADAVIRPFGNDYLTAQWAQSFDDSRPAAGLDSGMARLDWSRRSARGLLYQAGGKWAGPDHLPGLGFQPRSDFRSLYGTLGYGWYPGARTLFQSVTPSAQGYAFQRNGDREVETAYGQADVAFSLKSGLVATLRASHSFERLDAPLSFSESARVPAGTYGFDRATLVVTPGPTSRLTTGFNTTVGEFYDGTQLSIGVTPTWNPSAHLQVGLEYQLNRIRFGARQQRFDADLARIRLQYALDRHLSFTGFLQYNRAAAALAGNVRIRWQFTEGRDLWIVYNDQLNTDRLRPELPELPLSQERSLLVKLSYTLPL